MHIVRLKAKHQGADLSARIRRVAGSSLISYLRLAEASGSVAADASGHGYNGAYTGVALGQQAGFSHPVPLFDGATSFVNWYSAGLAGAFNGAAGTLGIYIRALNATAWSDATQRVWAVIYADTSNRVVIDKPSAGQLRARYIAGGVTSAVQQAYSNLAWFHLAVTWSKADDKAMVYINGARAGATMTGLGTWVGLPDSHITVIGATSDAPTLVWSGWLADAFLTSRALSAAEIAAVYAGGRP